MKKGSFILYDADLKALSYLTDAQIGKLFRAIADHRLEGIAPNLGKNPAVNILYDQIMEHISINEEKYKAICEKRTEAIKKRWENEKKSSQNNTNEYKSIEKNTSKYIYDNDNVNDIDNVNDNVNVACGAKRENKRKNYYDRKNNVPTLLRDNPAYDIDAFMRKSLENYRNAVKQSGQQ